MKLRLDKYLADMGLGTRSEVKQAVRKGRVQVNGQTVREPEYKTETETDQVWFNGQPAAYREYEYYMLNKPAGVISASEDPRERCVVDLIESRKRKDLFPVGRLDKDTEGLLLITNDGALAHRLLSPKSHVDKCYYARVQGLVTEEDVKKFLAGVDIGTAKQPERTAPGRLQILDADESSGVSRIRLVIQEGKYHQVKRMFAAVGKKVCYLRRESMGSLVLDAGLKPGEYRKLTDEELRELRDL